MEKAKNCIGQHKVRSDQSNNILGNFGDQIKKIMMIGDFGEGAAEFNSVARKGDQRDDQQ